MVSTREGVGLTRSHRRVGLSPVPLGTTAREAVEGDDVGLMLC